MKRISDGHWALLAPEQLGRTRQILETLEARKVRYVLAGGWAVYAHHATTPSVDCDVFLEESLPPSARSALETLGVRIGPQGELELLDLSRPWELLGSGEPDLGIPAITYNPAKVLEGRVRRMTLKMDIELKGIPIPDPAALAATKLPALQGRNLSYRCFFDEAARMSLGPSVAPMILSLGQSYYLRKAGKDLFDLSILLENEGVIKAARELLGPSAWAFVSSELRSIAPAVLSFADDLAERVERPRATDVLPRLLN
jgi:hypothetical protein